MATTTAATQWLGTLYQSPGANPLHPRGHGPVRVAQAVEAIGPEARIQSRAKTFALLGDPTRLTLLNI